MKDRTKELFLLLGGNDTQSQIAFNEATKELDSHFTEKVFVGSIIHSSPWGLKEQADYINQLVVYKTNQRAQEILKITQKIELESGRVRKEKWGPRILDIDILFYGNDVINTDSLKVPHPYIQDRLFALKALSEFNENLIHPILNKSIQSLIKECKDDGLVNFANQNN